DRGYRDEPLRSGTAPSDLLRGRPIEHKSVSILDLLLTRGDGVDSSACRAVKRARSGGDQVSSACSAERAIASSSCRRRVVSGREARDADCNLSRPALAGGQLAEVNTLGVLAYVGILSAGDSLRAISCTEAP